MIRKIVTLVAMLLVTTGALALPRSRAALSQYQYNHRLYIMASAGPMTTFSENSDSYATYGVGGDRLVYFGSVSLGYNVTDTWDIRLSGSYSRNAGALLPYRGFFPYSYNSVVVFADAVVNYNALGEHFIAFSPKAYFGVGGAYTYGFSETNHLLQTLEEPNFVPALRFGTILEYSLCCGLGLFMDLGVEALYDWYDGLAPSNFPFDFNLKASLGVIFHFPRVRK